MKDLLDRHRERLSEEEWNRFCAGLEQRLEGKTRPSEITLRRWLISSALAGALVVVAGLMVTLTEREMEDRRHGHALLLLSARNALVSGPATSDQVRLTRREVRGARSYRQPPRILGADRFTAAREESLSTFALGVSDSSYVRAKRAILDGSLPNPATVRPEEFVNFFRQDYPEVTGADFGIFLEGAPSAFTKGAHLLRVGLKARGSIAEGGPSGGRRGLRDGLLARDVQAEVVFDPRSVKSYRLLGFANRSDRPPAPPDTAGEEGGGALASPGQEVTALYEVRLEKKPASDRVATVNLHYVLAEDEGGGTGARHLLQQRMALTALVPTFPSASPRFRCGAAAAEFARILQGPTGTMQKKLRELLPVVRGLRTRLGADPDVLEFAVLVERAARLAGRPGARN